MNIIQKYTTAIANRLAAAQKGGTFEATMNVRNQEGLMHTFSRMLEMAEQYVLADPERTQDPAIALATFSKKQKGSLAAFSANGSNLGVSGAANLRTMDAMDISIATAAFSLIPYLAIERAMSNSATNISYQDIVAEYQHGEIQAGENVLGAFEAPNTKLSMGLPIKTETLTNSDSDPKDMTATLGPVMPESVTVSVFTSSDAETAAADGIDFNGKIAFTGTVALDASIDYVTGAITFKNVPASYKVVVKANIDTTSDSTGSSILTVAASYKNVLLTAKPQQMLFKDNSLKNAYLNKLNIQVAGTGLQMDYGEMAVGKLISIYIHYVNRLVVSDTIAAGSKTMAMEGGVTKAVTRNISGYMGGAAAAGFADNKNDYLKNFVIDLNQRSLDTTGKGITAILTGSRGANLLAGTPFFVKGAQYDELNAMIGTFDGIPVIRHQLIDQAEPAEGGIHKKAYFFGVYKDPSGSAAPVAFGEFLPVKLTDPVANYNNPEQIARSLSSYCGTAIVVPQLCHVGIVQFVA